MDKKIIEDAVELTKDIPCSDILTPLSQEEQELTPYPEIEYKIIEATSMDKVVRDVNTHLNNGRQTEWGIQVAAGPVMKFYQSLVRWNVDLDKKHEELVDEYLSKKSPKSEMPSENSEAGAMGSKGLSIPGLENEPDLYEDLIEDGTNS